MPTSLGEAIQFAATAQDLLDLCLQLPLASHPHSNNNGSNHLPLTGGDRYRYQRWSAQLLEKLGSVWPTNHYNNKDKSDDVGCWNGNNIWQDDRLVRAVVVAANLEHMKTFTATTTNVELLDQTRSVQWALQGLSTLAGKVPSTTSTTSIVHKDLLDGIRQLILRAEHLATLQRNGDGSYYCPLHQVVETRWAARGLLMRLGGPHVIFPTILDDASTTTSSNNHHGHKNPTASVSLETLARLLPNMQQRVQHLPFDIIPCGIPDWSSSWSKQQQQHDEIINCLLQEIPFCFDQILTRHGTLITERRGTAWVTEPGIGPMAYSGKVMPPHSPLPVLVQSIMRTIESVVDMEQGFFDCALCNWYPHDEAAMKFHSDPDHGTLWDRSAVVVAIGDPRRFAFRPNPNHKHLSWQVWDKEITSLLPASSANSNDGVSNTPAIIHLFSGDIVQMWGTCNDDFQHAVLQGNNPNKSENLDDGKGRISIVMKHALVRDES